jgi:hypothetical protein
MGVIGYVVIKRNLKEKSACTQDWPFCSDVCNKSFSDQNNLEMHQFIHSWEQPFDVMRVLIWSPESSEGTPTHTLVNHRTVEMGLY